MLPGANMALGQFIPAPPDGGGKRIVREQRPGEARAAWQGINPLPQPAPAAQAAPLPADAHKLVTDFEQEAAAIRLRAQRELAARQQKLIEELTKLQDAYSKPGTLDEAVAIRDRIRQLKAGGPEAIVDALPDPGMLHQFRGHVGRVFHFRVTGNTARTVWGTGVYTDDSALATAAVHAGILGDGQQGVVKVTILPGQAAYAGFQNNGVTSHEWQNWPGSYRVEAP